MIENTTIAWQYLTQGITYDRFMTGITYPYTAILGDWFYALFLAMTYFLIYMKTQNYGTTVIAAMLTLPAAIVLFPSDARILITVMVSIGITGILYRVFYK